MSAARESIMLRSKARSFSTVPSPTPWKWTDAEPARPKLKSALSWKPLPVSRDNHLLKECPRIRAFGRLPAILTKKGAERTIERDVQTNANKYWKQLSLIKAIALKLKIQRKNGWIIINEWNEKYPRDLQNALTLDEYKKWMNATCHVMHAFDNTLRGG